MRWSYCLVFLLALSLEGLAVVPQVREKRQQSTECQDGLLRIQEDCNGLNLTDVDAAENVDAALTTACTGQLCQEAIIYTLTACTPPTDIDQATVQRGNDLLVSFYCKRHSSGELCGELILKSDVSLIPDDECPIISPATVPDTCPPQCSMLASLLGQMFGCCWTEYVQYSMELTAPLLGVGANASELWSRCNVQDPGYCSSSTVSTTDEEVTPEPDITIGTNQPDITIGTNQPDININTSVGSGQITTMTVMKPLLLISVVLLMLHLFL